MLHPAKLDSDHISRHRAALPTSPSHMTMLSNLPRVIPQLPRLLAARQGSMISNQPHMDASKIANTYANSVKKITWSYRTPFVMHIYLGCLVFPTQQLDPPPSTWPPFSKALITGKRAKLIPLVIPTSKRHAAMWCTQRLPNL